MECRVYVCFYLCALFVGDFREVERESYEMNQGRDRVRLGKSALCVGACFVSVV